MIFGIMLLGFILHIWFYLFWVENIIYVRKDFLKYINIFYDGYERVSKFTHVGFLLYVIVFFTPLLNPIFLIIIGILNFVKLENIHIKPFGFISDYIFIIILVTEIVIAMELINQLV